MQGLDVTAVWNEGWREVHKVRRTQHNRDEMYSLWYIQADFGVILLSRNTIKCM